MQANATGSKVMPNATVTKLDSTTLKAGEYDVWDGNSLSEGTVDRPFQAVVNFKANDTLAEAEAGGFGKWIHLKKTESHFQKKVLPNN